MNKHLTFIATNPPICLAWDDAAEATPARMPPLLTRGERFVCDACGTDITRACLRVAVDGAHRHRLPRSFGCDQEYGCFSLAPGCLVHAPLNLLVKRPEDGLWRPVSCAGCGAALGWHHQNADGLGFFLLALENLRAESENEDSEAP